MGTLARPYSKSHWIVPSGKRIAQACRLLFLSILAKKTAHSCHEFRPRSFVFRQDVILTLERDELRPKDQRDQLLLIKPND
jgi:hypothetical protein